MKKISSILLALIIALSLSTVAFAAPATISAGQTKSITLNQGKKTTYTFTPTETAIYKLTFDVKNDCIAFCEVNNIEASDDILNGVIIHQDAEDDEGIYCFFPAQKGSVFTIALSEETDGDKDYENTAKFDMTLSKANLPSLKLNGTYTVTDAYYSWYAFMPTESGYYNFRSNSDDVDPSIDIFDDENNWYSNDDIGYEDDLNFDLSSYCEAGRIYLVMVSVYSYYDEFDEDYDYDDIDVNFSFTVKRAEDIMPECIFTYENKISMARRDYYFTSATIAPSGSVVNIDPDDITITSSNTRVADIDEIEILDNEIYFEIESYRLGKTTITIELSNGESADIAVRVRPSFIIFFENLFSSIAGLFSLIFGI